MNDLLPLATREIAAYLDANLPKLGEDWWQKHVLTRLSFQQQRMVQERRYTTLKQLDLAALLRIFDQNWFELSDAYSLSRDGRTWLKELQTVRNKWANLPADEMPPSEVYRDADTLGRFLALIGAREEMLREVEAVKTHCVEEMARIRRSNAPAIPSAALSGAPMAVPAGLRPTHAHGNPDASAGQMPSSGAAPTGGAQFKVGDLVSLRSNQDILVPVLRDATLRAHRTVAAHKALVSASRGRA